METVFLSLGSNLGERLEILQWSVEQLNQQTGNIQLVSHVYETEPWEMVSTHSFLNACVKLRTTLSATALLDEIQQIETNAGRKKNNTNCYQDRVLDIDIIFFGKLRIKEQHLTIPHPQFSQRNFVLFPLLEIIQDSELNDLNLNRIDLKNSCKDSTSIHQIQKTLSIPY